MGELYVSEDAAQALCRIGPAAATAVPELVPQLVAALRVPQRDDDDFLPSRAARILGAVGGVSVVPELVAAMKREDGRLADAAADALSRMGPPAIPSLVAALHDEQYHVRRLAVVSLAKLGPAAAEAVPALLTWGTRPGMGGPKLVGSTLAKIGLVAVRPVMDALPGGLSASDSRDALLETVIQMGRAAAEAVPILASVVIDRVASECVRRDVAKTLGQLGVVAADAVPALATVLRDMVDDDQAPREAAAKALAEIGGSAAVSALATALGRRHRNENIRNLSALALAKLGPAATAAVPDLASAYKDSSDRIVQKHILEALSRIGAAAVPAILDLSEVKSPIKRHEFAASLTRIGPQAIPAVRHAIGDSRPLVRAVAAEALAELEPRGFPEMVSPAVGLEQVKPEEMVEVREALHVFVQVGEWCEQHAPDTWQFSCIKLFNEGAVKGVKGQIISDSKIRRKLEEASKFFRWYFAEFEKIKDLVEDTAEGTNGNALEGRKIMLRWPEGRKGLYLQIYAHGQRAFTLARDYLRKRPLDNKSPKG
jgi:HEAT repeat protein